MVSPMEVGNRRCFAGLLFFLNPRNEFIEIIAACVHHMSSGCWFTREDRAPAVDAAVPVVRHENIRVASTT